MLSKPYVFTVVLSLCLFFLMSPTLPFVAANQTAKTLLSAEELTFLKKNPRIVLGTEKEWEPSVIMRKDGSIVGYDVDILKLVNQYTGGNFILKVGNWQEILEKAENREIDGLSSSAALAERKEYFNFSNVYNHLLRTVIVLKGNPLNIKKWDDLQDKKIVIQKGNQYDENVVKKLPRATIVRVDTIEALLNALISGKADAAFGQGAYMYLAGKLGISTLQYAFVMKDRLDLVFSLRNDWPEALSIMNKGLSAIAQDEYDRIYTKWYGARPENLFNYVLFFKITLPLALAAATLLAVYFRKINRRLLFVQSQLKKDIAHREQAQKKLDWELKINKALADLANTLISPDQSINEIASKVLSSAKALTESKDGFVSEIDRTSHINTPYSLSGACFNLTPATEPDFTIDLTYEENSLHPELWGHFNNSRESFFTNSLKNYCKLEATPQDNLQLDRYLSVPVKLGSEVIGQIALANAPFDYCDHHIEAVGQLADLYALALQRKRNREDGLLIEAQLRQAQKMEAIGNLAGGVAHDYNNISSIIIGYTELALDNFSSKDPLYADLMEILSAARRSTEITRQLLAFARRQTISPKVIDLNSLLEGMLKMLRRLIGENIDLVWLPSPDLWPIKIDPSQVDQLLANLCVNARDAIVDIGKVTIETKNVSIDRDYCVKNVEAIPGDYVSIIVSDDGIGIAPEDKDKIFDPFYTTKQVGQGTGLGLSTVYGIVKQNDGFINVYSEPENGTCFKVYFPRYAEKPVEDKHESAPKTPMGSNEAILLVEDESSLLKLGTRMLESLNYCIFSASTPSQAIEIAVEQGDKIKLLITDVVMPEMNGRELAEQIAAINPNIKTLYMSGYTANVIAHRGIIEEGISFISKPLSKRNLAHKVREVLDDVGGDDTKE